MKFWAAILLINITFFLLQPVFASQVQQRNDCIKTCCPQSDKDKKECPKNCNPLFTCIYCQYVVPKIDSVKNAAFIFLTEFNNACDSPVHAGYIKDRWHPPNCLQL